MRRRDRLMTVLVLPAYNSAAAQAEDFAFTSLAAAVQLVDR